MRVGMYVRAAPADGGLALDIQRALCQAWLEQQVAALVVVEFVDYASGTDLDRPGLTALRAAVQRGEVDVVLVARADRLARHLADLTVLIMEFDEVGVAVQVADIDQRHSTAPNRLLMGIEAACRQGCHNLRVQRLAQERQAARRMRRVADPAIIRQVFTLATADGSTSRLSAAALTAQLNRSTPYVVPLRGAIYARAATAENRAFQTATLRAAAAAAGWTVTCVAEDLSQREGIARPNLMAIREAARAGRIELLLVTSLDRLTRSASELAALRAELAASGCALVVLAADPIASAADQTAA